MNVEYSILKRTFDLHKEEYEAAALRALNSGWYILGKEMEKFEAQFAEYLGVKHCIAINSGTDALILAIRALGIGPGDEVIVPAGTYIASVIGITENGATPVFVDSDAFMEMDVEAIVSQIIRDVRKGKDKAVIEYCRRFDRVDLRSLEVTIEEIAEAKAQVSPMKLHLLITQRLLSLKNLF